jgi:hypothetical protein
LTLATQLWTVFFEPAPSTTALSGQDCWSDARRAAPAPGDTARALRAFWRPQDRPRARPENGAAWEATQVARS